MTQSILKGVGCVIGGIVLCGLLLGGCLGFGWVIGESNIPGEFAEIERIRAAIEAAPRKQGDDYCGDCLDEDAIDSILDAEAAR